MDILLNPNVAYLLLVTGLIVAALAMLTPGTGALEAGAAACFILVAYAMLRIPVSLWALVLLFVALVSLAWLRTAKRPTYLFLFVAGLEIGALYLFRGQGLRPAVHPLLALPTVLLTGSFLWVATGKIIEAERLQPVHDLGLLIGAIGEAKTSVHQEGSVLVNGELWSAQSDQPIPAGSRIRVLGRDGFVLKVAPYPGSG